MKEGEEGILIIPSKLGYGGGTQIIPQQIRDNYIDNEGEDDPRLRDLPVLKPLVFEVKLEDIL